MASVYWTILQAVQARVATVVPNCVLRKKLEALDQSDALPLCIVAPGAGGEKPVQQTFDKNVVYQYPVLVAYLATNSGQVDLQETFMDTREAIRNVLFQTLLPGVTPVWDTDIDPDEAEKFAAYLSTNYDSALWSVKFKSKELRTS